MACQRQLFNALIRTHHITSRKKVTKLRQAAVSHDVFVLLRSGGSPGMMYVEGQSDGVQDWIEIVQKLRYKDYQLVARPGQIDSPLSTSTSSFQPRDINEVATVKEFGEAMHERGVFEWWRTAMGYTTGPKDRL